MVDCALENLPTELRVQILFESTDFLSLRSLIHASPIYHASYLEAGREKVLCHVALKQWDPYIRPDVLAASRSERYFEHHTNEASGVLVFLDEYARARAKTTHLEQGNHSKNATYSNADAGWQLCRNMTEAADLLSLHRKIKLIADDYRLYATSRMRQGREMSSLTANEQMRLYRAICRYQTFCNFFGGNRPMMRPPYRVAWDRAKRREQSAVQDQFLPSFPPWEIEEMACIWQYLNSRWTAALREISHIVPLYNEYDDSQSYPKWDGAIAYLRRMNHDDLSEDSSDSGSDSTRARKRSDAFAWERRRDDLTNRGPTYLTRILSQITLEERRDYVLDELRPSAYGDSSFHHSHANLRFSDHLLYPADTYEQADIATKLSKLPVAERPTRGWKWFCQTYHIDQLGVGSYWEEAYYARSKEQPLPTTIESGAVRELKWGFPFWDEGRLKEWGVIMSYDGPKKKKKRKRIHGNESQGKAKAAAVNIEKKKDIKEEDAKEEDIKEEDIKGVDIKGEDAKGEDIKGEDIE